MNDALTEARIDELKRLMAIRISGVLIESQIAWAKFLIDILPDDPNRPCHACQIARGAVVSSVQGFFSCRDHLKKGL